MWPRRQVSDTCCQILFELLRIEEGWIRGGELKGKVIGSGEGKWTEANAHYALWKLVREGLVVVVPAGKREWLYTLAPIGYRPLPPLVVKAHMLKGKRADLRECYAQARPG